MTQKVFYCIPVRVGLTTALVFQLVVNVVYGGWLAWWLTESLKHDEADILKSLVDCSIALAAWEAYGAFIASIGLYGTLRRKRYMKNFIGVQALVWVLHFVICIWYLVTYHKFYQDQRIRACGNGSEDDEEEEFCEILKEFHTAPMGFILITFIVEFCIQSAVMFFLFHLRRALLGYQIVDSAETAPLPESVDERPTMISTRHTQASLDETRLLVPAEVSSRPI